MKSGKPVVNPFGFTIVEVMVVLAVTIIILGSAILAVNGRTQTAEFTQAVNDTQSSFQSIMNNVATGYYNNQSVYCSVTGSSPYATLAITSTANSNTGNGDCMFLGEAVMFTTGNIYYGFDVLGARQDINGSGLSTNYSEAQPTIPSISSLVTVNSLSNELVAQWVKYSTTSGGTLNTGTPTDILAFLDDPNAIGNTPAPTNSTASGAIGVNVIPVADDDAYLGSDQGTTMAMDTATREVNYSSTSRASLAQTADGNTKNPAGGVGVCFKSQSTNQSVLYTFGGNNRSTTIENQVFSGATC